MIYKNKADYKEIKRLADRICPHCQGKGLRTKDGLIVSSQDFDEKDDVEIVNSSGEKISSKEIFMVCVCVRRNIRFERTGKGR